MFNTVIKNCLVQYLGTGDLDPVLMSPTLQLLRNWGYTQLTRSSIKQFEISKSTTEVPAAAQKHMENSILPPLPLSWSGWGTMWGESSRKRQWEFWTKGRNILKENGKMGMAMRFTWKFLKWMGSFPLFPQNLLRSQRIAFTNTDRKLRKMSSVIIYCQVVQRLHYPARFQGSLQTTITVQITARTSCL